MDQSPGSRTWNSCAVLSMEAAGLANGYSVRREIYYPLNDCFISNLVSYCCRDESSNSVAQSQVTYFTNDVKPECSSLCPFQLIDVIILNPNFFGAAGGL